jgi:hypothetical protein
MSHRSRVVRVAQALAALALLAAAFAWWHLHAAPDLAGWDEARLTRELEALGYHVHAEPRDRALGWGPDGRFRTALAGVYAAREEPADWGEVAARTRADARAWRGCMVAVPGRRGISPGDPEYLAAGPWLLVGDPKELDRIAGRLGLAR